MPKKTAKQTNKSLTLKQLNTVSDEILHSDWITVLRSSHLAMLNQQITKPEEDVRSAALSDLFLSMLKVNKLFDSASSIADWAYKPYLNLVKNTVKEVKSLVSDMDMGKFKVSIKGEPDEWSLETDVSTSLIITISQTSTDLYAELVVNWPSSTTLTCPYENVKSGTLIFAEANGVVFDTVLGTCGNLKGTKLRTHLKSAISQSKPDDIPSTSTRKSKSRKKLKASEGKVVTFAKTFKKVPRDFSNREWQLLHKVTSTESVKELGKLDLKKVTRSLHNLTSKPNISSKAVKLAKSLRKELRTAYNVVRKS